MTTTEESIRKIIRQDLERVACRAYLSATQSDITSATPVKVGLDLTTYDLGLSFSSNKFTAPVTGLYSIIGQVSYASGGVQADKKYSAIIKKNTVIMSESSSHASHVDVVTATITDELYLNKNDYIELFAYTSGTGNTVDILGDTSGTYTFLVIRLVSKEGTKQ